VTMPSSAQICGWAVGMVDKHSDPAYTYECYNPRCADTLGHEQWECPQAFAVAFPGRLLPGWKADGVKDPAGWGTDHEPNDQTRRAWAALIAAGFFTSHPYPGSDFAFPDPSQVGGSGG
jgi:hypothetical protein